MSTILHRVAQRQRKHQAAIRMLQMARASQPEEAEKYAKFCETYMSAPARFIRDCFKWPAGVSPAGYQYEIADALVRYKRVCVRGPHGLGKTALSAWMVLWFALTRDGIGKGDWKIVTTASVWRQLDEFLWPEIHKWARKLRWDKVGRPPLSENELMLLSLTLKHGSAFAIASDKASSIEGAHADSLLYIFDEAKAIPPDIFDAAEGAFSGTGEVYVMAVSTPGDTRGRFYDIQARKAGYEEWWVRHVTLEDAIAAGRVSPEWAKARREQWGESSKEYINRVLGDFAPQDDSAAIIPRSWVHAAQNRWCAIKQNDRFPDVSRYGVDVGLTVDKCVIAERCGEHIRSLFSVDPQNDITRIVAEVDVRARLSRSLRHGLPQIVVDVIGVGAGVAHRLRQMGHLVVAYDAREKTSEPDISGELRFANRRARDYWRMRELLDPNNEIKIALPNDQELEDDLCAPTYRQNASGAIVVESKEEIREKLGRSPDKGDAVVMAYTDSGVIRKPPIPGRRVETPIG